jgi:DNA polymerase-3 subunit chi
VRPMGKGQQRIAEYVELRAPHSRLPAVCNLAERHFERGEAVVIYSPDPSEADELDALLWTLRQNSFVPHVRWENASEPVLESVLIFGGEPPESVEAEVLVVASADGMPGWFTRFPHVYDFALVYDDALRQASRERYAVCKAAGYQMRFIRPREG